jgi:hypothetical protein
MIFFRKPVSTFRDHALIRGLVIIRESGRSSDHETVAFGRSFSVLPGVHGLLDAPLSRGMTPQWD